MFITSTYNVFIDSRPRRVSELTMMDSDSDEEDIKSNHNLNCAILNDSFVLSPSQELTNSNSNITTRRTPSAAPLSNPIRISRSWEDSTTWASIAAVKDPLLRIRKNRWPKRQHPRFKLHQVPPKGAHSKRQRRHCVMNYPPPRRRSRMQTSLPPSTNNWFHTGGKKSECGVQ